MTTDRVATHNGDPHRVMAFVMLDIEMPALAPDDDTDIDVYRHNMWRIEQVLAHAFALIEALPDHLIKLHEWTLEDYESGWNTQEDADGNES